MCAFHYTTILVPVGGVCKTVVQKLHNRYNKHMFTDIAAIRTYFSKLGFEPEIADLYLALHAHGPQTISELSRNSKVERTRIYRLIDRLMEANLIEVESRYKRGVIRAAPIANLHILISEKEQELKSLQDELGLIEQVLARNSLSSPATRVQFYQGPEGIRQMQWNLFRAKKDIHTIMHRPMHDVTGSAFFKRWAERWNNGDWSCHILLDDHFLRLSDKWHKENPGNKVKDHFSKTIDPLIFPISFEVDIYDDVVAYYNWHDNEVFGIEIYNKDIANAQRTFFNMLWDKASPTVHDLGSTAKPI